jgi:hypothetical protein
MAAADQYDGAIGSAFESSDEPSEKHCFVLLRTVNQVEPSDKTNDRDVDVSAPGNPADRAGAGGDH